MANRKTILLLEDERGLLDLYTSLLKRQNLEVLQASGFEEGLRLWQANRGNIDAIITDASMGSNANAGFDFIRAVRTLDKKIPITLLSGTVEEAEEVAERLKTAGGADFIAKTEANFNVVLKQWIERNIAREATR